jgi:hypothetical protein
MAEAMPAAREMVPMIPAMHNLAQFFQVLKGEK